MAFNLDVIEFGFGANADNLTTSAGGSYARVIQSSSGIQKHIRSIIIQSRPQAGAPVVFGAHISHHIVCVRFKPVVTGSGGTDPITSLGQQIAVAQQRLFVGDLYPFKDIKSQGVDFLLMHTLYQYSAPELVFDEGVLMCEDGQMLMVVVQGPTDQDTGASITARFDFSVNGSTVNKSEPSRYTLR